MVKFRILLMDCTRRTEPSEATFLSEFFKMMNRRYPKSIEFSPIEINDKMQFLEQLRSKWANIIHISAHGYSSKSKSGRRGKRTSIYIKDERVTSEEISKLPKVPRKLISVSACLTSYQDMANAFLKIGAKHYIAPKTNLEWIDAALFYIMFYKRYLYDRKSLDASFKYARKNTKLGKHFQEYWYMK